MCILCEPKYETDEYGDKQQLYVANKVIYHRDRSDDPWEVTNEPEYNGEWGGFYIVNGNDLHAVADDACCGAGPLTINYCPICGRKLEYKEDE